MLNWTKRLLTRPVRSSRPTCPLANLVRRHPVVEELEPRITPQTNTFTLKDMSGLPAADVWVAGYINGGAEVLQQNGTFAAPVTSGSAPYYNVSSIPTVTLTQATNGNDRLVFLVSASTPASYPVTGYTAYPFTSVVLAPPPGPYDIFEFGNSVNDDISAVDSFGLNLSFTAQTTGGTFTAGTGTTTGGSYYSRNQILNAYKTFVNQDPEGKTAGGLSFQELLYTSPTGNNYPPAPLGNEYSAIISPKDWLTIYPNDPLLSGYWSNTITAFFTTGNQLNIDLGFLPGDTSGNPVIYSGSSTTAGIYTLNSSVSGFPTETIPASQFTSDFVFTQNLPALANATQGSLYDAILEAFERGVALDGVFPSTDMNVTAGASSTAWDNTANWYTNHLNAYNGQPSVYDVYAKFLHYSNIDGQDFQAMGASPTNPIFDLNSAGLFGMAYGFSLDENPFPEPGSTFWPISQNVPSKTPGDTTSATITLGPYGSTAGATYVANLYPLLLHRSADANGAAYWTNLLNSLGNTAAARAQIVTDIEQSPEYLNDVVTALYQHYLERAPDPGAQGWVTDLEKGATIEQVTAGIASSSEFFQKEAQETNSGYLSALYKAILGRTPDIGGFTFWLGQLNSGVSRAAVAMGFLTSLEYRADLIAGVGWTPAGGGAIAGSYLQGYYLEFLHRQGDLGGVASWILALEGGMTDQQVVAGIAGSAEFYNKWS